MGIENPLQYPGLFQACTFLRERGGYNVPLYAINQSQSRLGLRGMDMGFHGYLGNR